MLHAKNTASIVAHILPRQGRHAVTTPAQHLTVAYFAESFAKSRLQYTFTASICIMLTSNLRCMKKWFTGIFVLLLVTGYAQSEQTIEQLLLKEFKAIDKLANSTSGSRFALIDTLEVANFRFRSLLQQTTARFPATLGYAFKALQKEGLRITTSADGLFRIYSWDTQTGGTMRFFENVYQYSNKGKVMSTHFRDSDQPTDPGYTYGDIYVLKSANETVYLARRQAMYSTSDMYEGIKAFSIAGDSLNTTIKIIKTKTGIRNGLGFNYNYFSVVDQPARAATLIQYDAAKKILRFAVVLADGKVTAQHIVYQFTGSFFERIK